MKSGLYISAAALTREIEEDGWLLGQSVSDLLCQ